MDTCAYSYATCATHIGVTFLGLLGEFDTMLYIFQTRFLDDTLLRPVPTPQWGIADKLYIAYVTDFLLWFNP